MGVDPPSVVVLAGPNGAGKSTAAPHLIQERLQIVEFVNADEIARGLAGFAPEVEAIAAGRIMIARIRELAAERASFAFESTLASRVFASYIKSMRADGYLFRLVFLHLPSADAAVARVAGRVREGGHGVPEEVVRRRYQRGLRNLFTLYLPIADEWAVYDSSGLPLLIASSTTIAQPEAWTRLQTQYSQ